MESANNNTQQKMMLPPPPGTFKDREELITYVRNFGVKQGYILTIKNSLKDRRVILGCDRGGGHRNKCKTGEPKRKRKASSRPINCPFQVVGRKDDVDDVWVLIVKNSEHNHEHVEDMSDHRYSRRFTEEEVRVIKEMTEAGANPREVLETLKQNNPMSRSTPRHLYNLKTKIRLGHASETSFKPWRPGVPTSADSSVERASEERNYEQKLPNFIGGKFVDSEGIFVDVVNPATQEVVSQVPLTTFEEFKDAISSAKQAFPLWKNKPISTRQRIMLKLLEIIRRDIDELASSVSAEQGATIVAAHTNILRGVEVAERACRTTALQMGQFLSDTSNDIDMYSIREPLGVCAGICQSNSPALVSLLMFPIAILCGNTFVLKPSEKVPGASMKLAALAMEAGLPDGVFNIIHGDSDIINLICDDYDILAISIVGSYTAGMDIYANAAARGKCIQAHLGSKYHAVVMPDAFMETTIDALVAAGFGAAREQCMSLSSVIFVGHSEPWEEELVKRAKALKVNGGMDDKADLGPVISFKVKDMLFRCVQSAVESGAKLILDGRNITVPGYEKGNFVGPTILSGVTNNMECYKEDIFGPVLLCTQVNCLEEAISFVNGHKFGTEASIFTSSGVAARKFQNEVEAGLVGVNVSLPIPLPCSSTGLRATNAAILNFCGRTGIQFYTQVKMVAQHWSDLPTGSVLSTKTKDYRNASNQAVTTTFSTMLYTNILGHENLRSVPATLDTEMTNHAMPLSMPSTENVFNSEASTALAAMAKSNLQNQATSVSPSSSMSQVPVPHSNLYKSRTSRGTEALRAMSYGSENIPRGLESDPMSLIAQIDQEVKFGGVGSQITLVSSPSSREASCANACSFK